MSRKTSQRIGNRKAREVIRALKALGGEVSKGRKGRRGKGSHTLIKMPGVARKVTIQDDEFDIEMLKTVCRQAGLDWDVFMAAFK